MKPKREKLDGWTEVRERWVQGVESKLNKVLYVVVGVDLRSGNDESVAVFGNDVEALAWLKIWNGKDYWMVKVEVAGGIGREKAMIYG